ncbi:metalloprotease TldD [Accumulibacter sp.]|uniref:metalloprotease TldD n=1 Tax=Accumulibacter sp. TaxID=2053492 RepID=UPI0025F077A1|nr:metalloprotease TldD [Accumulibacter sp.]MCM8594699.1 metalloprotease TldD [Accumulibacter sp.]MCM8625885.1 metalloprotease TldD [Accumulibacter sp.]MDS4048845.1 metalloprotease TldD [Accumulibacter sp.]
MNTGSRSLLEQATRTLLTPYGLEVADLEPVLARIVAHRVDYADLYFQYSRSEAWSLEEGIVKAGSFNIDEGVGVRALSGEKTAFAYSDDISAEALGDAAAAVRAIAAAGQQRRVPAVRKRRGHRLYAPLDPLASLDAASKVSLLERLEAMARAEDPRVSQVIAHLAGEYEVILVAGSDGRLAADVRPLVRVSLTVIVDERGRREQGSAGGGGRTDYGCFSDRLLQEYAREAVHQAVTNLAARPAPAGTMPVVLGSGWPGILLHEAVGHGLEGDFNRKGSSTFAGRVGSRVAAPGVTVIDDGTIPGRRGSLNIDDEGNPTQRNVLIDDGILVGYMQDALNARLMGVAPTGNGRRESFAHLPLPRMTNTTMLAGERAPEEIIASVRKGIYAVNFGGGQVDITNGKFVFSMAEAYLIENGKVTAPVKGATLIGSGPEAMKQVSLIGNDLRLDPGVGTCGKDGQSVPVGVGQPTLRIDGLTVGGTG